MGSLKRLLDGVNELMMRNRAPSLGGIGSGNASHFGKIHMGSSAVKNKVRLSPCAGGRNEWV